MITRAENVVPNAVSPLTCHVGAQNMSLFGIAPTVANPQPAPPIPQPAPPNPQPTPIISQPTAVQLLEAYLLHHLNHLIQDRKRIKFLCIFFASVLNRQVFVFDVETVLKTMVLYPLLCLI